MDQVERLVNRPSRSKRPPEAGPFNGLAAVLGNLRERMCICQHQPRVAFVIPQQDVEARLHALDVVGLQQQRFGFRVGGHNFHCHRFGNHAPQPFGQAVDMGIRCYPLFKC